MALLESDMSTCIRQMKQLQLRMTHLEKQQQQNELDRIAKETTVEPNLAVMEKWVCKSKDNIAFQQKVSRYRERRRRNEQAIDPELEEWICESRRVPTKHYDVGIFDHMKGAANGGGGRNKDESQQEFMLKFVEATHNLFKILTKRIDALIELNEQ